MEIELITIIAKAVSEERKTYLMVGLILLFMGGFLFWNGYQKNAALVIISLLLIVTGIKLLYDKIREPHGFHAPIIIFLTGNKENVVWVYSIVKENMPFGLRLVGSGRVMLRTLDRREFSISISQENLAHLEELLRKHLPHATFGYSAEKENMYSIDPYLLLD